jgi:hypothetical protein
VTIVSEVRTGVHVSDANVRYLETKVRRGAHKLDLPRSAEAEAVESDAAAAL